MRIGPKISVNGLAMIDVVYAPCVTVNRPLSSYSTLLGSAGKITHPMCRGRHKRARGNWSVGNTGKVVGGHERVRNKNENENRRERKRIFPRAKGRN